MKQEDARKLSSAAQHECRQEVIRAYKCGVDRHQIAQQVGAGVYCGLCFRNRVFFGYLSRDVGFAAETTIQTTG
jgi:hypothetical protein